MKIFLYFPEGKDDPGLVESFRKLWKEVLKHGLSIAAFTENPNGGKPIIAAVNVLVLCHKDDKMEYGDSMVIFIIIRIYCAIVTLCLNT